MSILPVEHTKLLHFLISGLFQVGISEAPSSQVGWVGLGGGGGWGTTPIK